METTEKEEEEYTMFHLTSKDKQPYRVELLLNRVHTSVEVDTGAAATIINEETYKRISEGNQVKNRPQLETAKVKLRTYTGELVKVIGTLNVIVKYEKQEVELQTLVVEGWGPNLLGRDWLRVLTLNWKELIHVDPEARPKFLKAKPVPYAMMGKIEVKLKRLQDEGTIEPVQFSEWVTPLYLS